MTYINRDPFARTELHREARDVSVSTCSWCGSVRTRKNGPSYLYRYSTESDGGRRYEHRGLFCSKSCHDSYHEK